MILYESVFKRIEYIAEFSLLKQIFYESTREMTEDDFKAGQFVLVECAKAKLPQLVLSDLTNFHFRLSADLQDWINDNIFEVGGRYGVKKLAHISSKDYENQLDVELVVDDYVLKDFENRFFTNEEEAMNWLLAK